MAHVNIEIKARCPDRRRIRRILSDCGPEFRGEDHQIDTYFRSRRGRLKLREGRIENSLIYYDRPDRAGPKRADVILHTTDPPADDLKAALTAAMGVQVVVDKTREIYFIDNVKFHIDRVEGLGDFIEIEAIDAAGDLGVETLRAQCKRYMDLLGIDPADRVERSYSDMLAETEVRRPSQPSGSNARNT